MARIEDSARIRNEHKPPIRPKVQPPKPEPPKAEPFVQANAKRSETQNAGVQQKLLLNQKLERNERDNSLLIGGTAGSTAGQFGQSEANVRNSGRITIKNTELSYDYVNHQYIRNPNQNTSNFVTKVEADLNKLAPGTRVVGKPNDPLGGFIWDAFHGKDTAAIVKPAPVNERIGGHDAGYRLIDQLKNNPNEVAIHKFPNTDNAFAAPRNHHDSLGTTANPGRGSAVDVTYNPDAVIDLPAKNTSGQLVSSPTDPALILGHEFNHASHMQRGTNDPVSGHGGKNNVFNLNGQNFIEADHPGITLREEFRTVGMPGYSHGSEPTENLLRKELGVTDSRVSYQGQNAHQPVSSSQAFFERTSTRLQTTSNAVVDGVRGSRNSALLGAGFGAFNAIASGKDAQGVVTDTAVGAGTGVGQEVIERLVNGPRAATSGMTPNAFRAAASQVKGAAVAGAVINTGFAIYDQVDNLKNDATRSQAVGVIAGEAVVGAASGAAGAYAGAMAGAAIGSIVPGVGTVIGGVVGFGVGMAAGYLADKGLRGIGVDKLVAQGVTAAYDGISSAASTVANGISDAANSVAEGTKNFFGGAANKLASIFG